MITNSEMRTITLWHHVLMMSKSIEGMQGFPSFYASTLPPSERGIVERFEADKVAAAEELAPMFEDPS